MNLNTDTKVNQECNSSEQNKPIVYWDGKHFASKDKSSLADIPLYTTPQTKPFPWGDVSNEKLIQEVRDRGYKIRNAEIQTKPLSDEEIYDLINNVPDYEIGLGELYQFARAIEERHGIK